MRDKAGEDALVAAGFHAVSALLKTGRVSRLFLRKQPPPPRRAEILTLAEKHAAAVQTADEAALDKMSGHCRHQGVVALASPPQLDWRRLLASGKTLAVLDGVTDPVNLGAVMRTACAFSAVAVIVPKRRSSPLSAAAVKAAGGAAANLPLLTVVNLRRALLDIRQNGWTIVGADENGTLPLGDFLRQKPPSPWCWVLGGEARGLRRLTRESCDYVVRIPTVKGDDGCLNVAAAAAICLSSGMLRLPE